MKYIIIGKIVNTHGIKGELRLLSSFKYKEKVFKKDMKIYIGKKKEEETIVSYRKHKSFDMICLKGYSNINEVLKYKGLYAFINKEDLVLELDEYLDEDLIDLEVYINSDKKGIVTNIVRYPNNSLIEVTNNDKKYLIPNNKNIIESIDLTNKKIIIKDIKGLIE